MIDLGHPARGLAFIRRIETEETYAGSPIILTDQSREKIARQQFTVLAVGGVEFCEDEDCEREHAIRYTEYDEPVNVHLYDVAAGDWVLVRNRAWAETPDPNVFVVRQEAIVGKFIER